MEVTESDKILYTSAVEYLYNKFEIAGEFVKNNGLTSVPVDLLTDMMIISMKEWLKGNEGEHWLSTIGYFKTSVASVTTRGFASIDLAGTELCSVCSGNFMATRGSICERCGEIFCGPCVSVVDKDYGVTWCNTCLEEEGFVGY